MLTGVHAFPSTPYHADGLDLQALQSHLDRLLRAGIHGIVPCGSTGEFAYLSEADRQRVVEATLEAASSRAPVTVMTTALTTAEAIRHARHASTSGAAAQLVNLHSYFPLTEDEAFRHLSAVAEAAPELPLVVYNSPAVTGFSMSLDFLERLTGLPQLIGIKESSADVNSASKIVGAFGNRLQVVCGHEALALPLLVVGATGWMSALTNLTPAACVALYDAFQAADLSRAIALHKALQPLANFLQDNQLPVAVKSILTQEGKGLGSPMRPLLTLPSELAERGHTIYQEATAALDKVLIPHNQV